MDGVTQDKVPTEITYDGNICKWGFQIKDGQARHQWFKLDLDEEQMQQVSQLTLQYPDPHALPPSYNKSPADLSVDFLGALKVHTEAILKAKLGVGVMSNTLVEYIITVPAIWSDAAQNRTRVCARRAGMGENVRIISEPEAAVIYTIDAMSPRTLEVGDTFVLCDAGGGTVDLISYSIIGLNPTKVQEAAPGNGQACGSTFLNRVFRKNIEDNFGHMEDYGTDTLEAAMDKFETITKRKFAGDGEDLVIPVPGLETNRDLGVSRGKLTISSKKMQSLWEPVITAITMLVSTQIKISKNVKAVLLVGGFGQNPYLKSCIKKVVGPKVEVIQPANGWTAVVRGALIKGLAESNPSESQIAIASRVARKYYGTSCSIRYDKQAHAYDRAYYDGFCGHHQVTCAYWLVEKGSRIEETKPIITDWTTYRRASDGPFLTYEVTIHAYSDVNDTGAPQYIDSAGVKLVARLTADLSSIPHHHVKVQNGVDSHQYNVLDFEIRINFFSAHTEYSLWVENKRYGTVQAEYV